MTNFRAVALSVASVCIASAVCAQEGATSTASNLQDWAHEYLRGPVTVPCLDNEKENCVWHRLIVDNQSDDTLECFARIVYDGADRAQASTLEHKMVVVAHARRVVLGDTTSPEVNATSHTVQCAARKPPDSSKLTPKCKPTVLNAPSELDYPLESRKLSEEGPVLLDFSLTDKEAHPTDIVVVGSSLYPRLDEAGIKYVAQFVGAANCKHGRFRIPVTFQLK